MIDLHTHSTYSDGTLSPGALVAQARQEGVTVLALCDHNTVDGLPEFLAAARGASIEAVAGVEFSTEYEGTELHILGLFIQPEHYGAVKARLVRLLEEKERSNRDLVRGLTEAGLPLDYETIRDATPGGNVNRAVIAGEMVQLGYCDSVKAAFRSWLSPERGFFRPPKRPDAFETIRFLRTIGAVSVLAHPFLNLEEPALRRFLDQAAVCGLDAMETRYSKFTPEQTALAEAIAEEYGLLMSGGSDFHGANKPDIRLGRGRGDLQVPGDYWEKLAGRGESRRAGS